jgi:hypothetical protein
MGAAPMTDKPRIIGLAEKIKERQDAAADVYLYGLGNRLRERAEKAEAEGDQELAAELLAGAHCADVCDLLDLMLQALDDAKNAWGVIGDVSGRRK